MDRKRDSKSRWLQLPERGLRCGACQVPSCLDVRYLVGSPRGQGGGADPEILRIGLMGDGRARGKRRAEVGAQV